LRTRTIPSLPTLSPGAAIYIVERLIAERRLHPVDVDVYLLELEREIVETEQRLRVLRAAAGPTTATAPVVRSSPSQTPGRRRRGQTKAAAPSPARQLQGRFVGFIRQIPAAKRPHYQQVMKDQGYNAAILAMRQTLGK
jgi:hypothetical protein